MQICYRNNPPEAQAAHRNNGYSYDSIAVVLIGSVGMGLFRYYPHPPINGTQISHHDLSL